MNAHTARAYAAAQRDYRTFVQRSGQSDLSAWVEDMQRRNLAANTIRQRTYLVRAWLGVEEDVALPARRTIRETKWLDSEQVRAVLSVIPKDRDGWRDFALLTALLITGLRVDHVRTWKRSDIRCSGGSSRIKNWNLPKVVCEALQAAFETYGDSHVINMPLSYVVDDAPVFTTSKCRQPLSPQEINRRIGRYARLA